MNDQSYLALSLWLYYPLFTRTWSHGHLWFILTKRIPLMESMILKLVTTTMIPYTISFIIWKQKTMTNIICLNKLVKSYANRNQAKCNKCFFTHIWIKNYTNYCCKSFNGNVFNILRKYVVWFGMNVTNIKYSKI